MATESYIHQLNQRTPAHQDQDYLDYVLINHATVPDRSDYILDHSKPSPLLPLQEDIEQLNAMNPDFYTIPCNTAHYFFEELQATANAPILHMPREAVKEIQAQYPDAKRVGIVATRGTIADHIYDEEIESAGYEFVRPSKEIQEKTNELIYDDIKDQDIVDRNLYHEFVQQMFDEMNCDVVILGCTELSLAQEREPIEGLNIIDAQSVLVDRTLELALKEQK